MSVSPLQVESLPLQADGTCDERAVPAAYQCRSASPATEDAHTWIRERRDVLQQQLEATGVILFRGFGLQTPEDFDRFVSAFGEKNFPYEESLSNAVRVVRTERVFSANEAPPEVTIFLHHEMAQTPISPRKLFFFCEIAASEGGATPVCRSDLLLERLAEEVPQFVADCESKGLKYTNVMPGQDDASSGMGRSWRSTLRASDHAEAEDKLSRLSYSWEWLDDDCLRATTPVLPAVREISPGRRSFFNQLIAASKGWKDSRNDPSKAIIHGDGQPLDQQAVFRATELAQKFTYNVAWQPGDVAMVDNCISMHARQPFRGTRKVWASLAGAERNAIAD
ncbi:MAG: TauD/TfdA family dioxygenase [Planctomycetaceae bacterium]|nr:TauD/TfdA family dioxygenase [Planctomycetaceae bacterium]